MTKKIEKRNWCVANDNGDVIAHDCDQAYAEEIAKQMQEEEPEAGWEAFVFVGDEEEEEVVDDEDEEELTEEEEEELTKLCEAEIKLSFIDAGIDYNPGLTWEENVEHWAFNPDCVIKETRSVARRALRQKKEN